jgi:hypothetical protein
MLGGCVDLESPGHTSIGWAFAAGGLGPGGVLLVLIGQGRRGPLLILDVGGMVAGAAFLGVSLWESWRVSSPSPIKLGSLHGLISTPRPWDRMVQ